MSTRPYLEILQDLAANNGDREALLTEFENHPEAKQASIIAGGWIAVCRDGGYLHPSETAAYIAHLLKGGKITSNRNGEFTRALRDSRHS